MTNKSGADRIKAYRERKKLSGYIQINIVCHKDDVQKIKDFASSLLNKPVK